MVGAAVPSLAPANDLFSGQMPVSRTPTTTPRPALDVPPREDQRPPLPVSLRKSTEFLSSVALRSVSLLTATTPAVRFSVLTCDDVRSAVKALRVTEKLWAFFTPTRAATLSCSLPRYVL